jgi:hypothetical protein
MNIFLDLDGVIHESQEVAEYNHARIFAAVPEYKGAKDFVKQLKEVSRKVGYNLMVISKVFVKSTDDRYIYQYKDKLKRCRMLGFSYGDSIILASNTNKNIFCQKGDILIDDFGQNISSWEKIGGIGIQFGEHKDKEWITAKNYEETLQKLKLILSAKAMRGDLVV